MSLIMFCVLFCISTLGSLLFCVPLHRWLLLSMRPPRNILPNVHTLKKHHFKSAKADMKYNDCYNKATIIMERVVQLESLKDTFISMVFKERTWTKRLNPIGIVYSEIIKEFFSNATIDGDRIECWVRHKEFVITTEMIQDFLEICPSSQPISVQYEDRISHRISH